MTPAMAPERAKEIAAGFDLRALPPDFYANPYPVYALLRETEPVKRMPDGSYFLTRYADLVSVYRDAQAFSSDKKVEFTPKYGAGSALLEHHTTSLVFNDPPLHTRVRKLIMGALTRRAIADMEPGLIALVDSLLDRIEAQGRRRPDRGLRQRHPGGDHRQPAGRAPCRPRPLARLVAGHPGRAGAQAHTRAGGPGQSQRERVHRLSRDLGGRSPQAPGRPRARRAHAPDPGRGRGRKAERDRAAAKLRIHPQRRPRNHHQPDRQRAGGVAGVARGKGSPARAHAAPGAGSRRAGSRPELRHRRIPALRVVQPARQPPRPSRMPGGRRALSRKVRW